MKFKQYETELRKFKAYIDNMGSETTTDDELEALYKTYFEIKHQDHSIKIPFDATIWNAICATIDEVISEL